MPTRLQRRVFWFCSRIAIALYRRFPIFGPLRGVVAVIREDNLFLVIERSDGMGLSFPGGLAHRGESDEQALTRELLEETGLRASAISFLMRYTTDWPYPARTAVFAVRTEGELRASWEGTPSWKRADEIEKRIMRNQRPVLQKALSQ